MSPRVAVVLLATLAACGTTSETGGKEPRNAKEKQQLEAAKDPDNTKKWGAWRYQGERNDCFYVLGRKCFKTENTACQAAHCKSPKTCEVTGGGPATVTCK
ncbi:MAG: hypothetical protein NT062_18510 [Proteobacteria bacterium]|nr:hypothetical protein [Pseudomonadota bacterium]